MKNQYKITLLEFARVKSFPNVWLYDGRGPLSGGEPIIYSMCLLESENHTILVDTGYDMENPRAFDFSRKEEHEDYKSPAEVLRAVGVEPEDIKDIILTHAHWDHMGGLDFFPNARIHVQREEIEKWKEMVNLPRQFSSINGAAFKEDIEKCLDREKAGLLDLMEGDVSELFPGINIRVFKNGHTFASSCILVNTKAGEYALVGDIAFVRKNFTGINNDGVMVPSGLSSGSSLESLRAMDEIMGLVGGNVDRIIFSHDSGVFDRCENTDKIGDVRVARIS